MTKGTGKSWKPVVSPALWTALRFCRDFKPDTTIIGGDFLDFPKLCKAEEKNRLKQEGQRLAHDFELGNQVLDEIDGFSKEKVFLIGNHDARLQKFIEEYPELEGLISLEGNLRLKERGYTVIPENKAYKMGHARFIHGWYFGMHHAKKTVNEMGDNVFYGHVHDVQAHTKANYDQMPLIGYSMGCLCDLDPEWRRGRPNRWVNGFGVFYFSSDGAFTFYNPIIIKGGFWGPNGKYYTAGGKFMEING
jgi:hypothetical protein